MMTTLFMFILVGNLKAPILVHDINLPFEPVKSFSKFKMYLFSLFFLVIEVNQLNHAEESLKEKKAMPKKPFSKSSTKLFVYLKRVSKKKRNFFLLFLFFHHLLFVVILKL